MFRLPELASNPDARPAARAATRPPSSRFTRATITVVTYLANLQEPQRLRENTRDGRTVISSGIERGADIFRLKLMRNPSNAASPFLTQFNSGFLLYCKFCTCTKTVNEHLIAGCGGAGGSSRLKQIAHLTHEGEFFHKEGRKSHRNKEAESQWDKSGRSFGLMG